MWEWVKAQLLVEAIGLYEVRSTITNQVSEEKKKASGERIKEQLETARNLSCESMERYERVELERKRSVETKAKNNLLGVTLALSIVSTGAGVLSRADWKPEAISFWATLTLILVVVAAIYFLVAGWFAFEAMQVGRVYQSTSEHEANRTTEEFVALRLWHLKMNQRVTILRTNALSVSFTSIRNGILSLALAACLAVVSFLAS